ncbi:hypothetical protein QGM71_10670 [Virgibacillus sp. C22-A2]|uniref:Uncharacterized protein n=1 Tax=Virgibacillus tibetensis TaxID=3042313 RepID=A0ABU6KFM2_9BACI|nr:hypothetical protein [Virgibacillus sp. C22-A2]
MKRIATLILLCIFLTGFDHADKLKLTDSEITIIKSENILRYDFKIMNIGEEPIKSEFDYPGHHIYGIEIVVRPNEELAMLMEMDENSSYKKMLPMGSGFTGYFQPNVEAAFHIEYKIKEDSNLKEVTNQAKNATLLILDGIDIETEIPLNN